MDVVAVARARRRFDPAALRHLRRQVGVSQQALAREVGVDASSISLWEAGARRPTAEHLLVLMDVLDRLAGALADV